MRICRVAHDDIERFAERRQRRGGGFDQRLLDGLGLEVARCILVEDLEIRRHAGLEREPLQQALGEGMDRLHLEPARRFDGVGKERPCKFDIGVGDTRAQNGAELFP